jgi:hypothetical protein
MASASPLGQPHAGTTARIAPDHRRARLLALCALLALVAVLIGIILGASRNGGADADISGQSVIATPLPNMPTPTPLANKPTPTVAPTIPTVIPPTSIPPAVAAPLAQPAPANVAPNGPHDDGKSKGKGKGKGD